jgi:uncharacterized protein YoxC
MDGVLQSFAEVEELVEAIAKSDLATMTAQINEVKTTSADLSQANARIEQDISAVKNIEGENPLVAAVRTLKEAFVDGDAAVARFSLRIDADGTITGIEATSRNGPNPISELKILASVFKIVESVGGTPVDLFTVDGSEVVVLPPMRSANFESGEGGSGWRLGDDGVLEADAAVFRNAEIYNALPPPMILPPAGNFDHGATLNVQVGPLDGMVIRYTKSGANVVENSTLWPTADGVVQPLPIDRTTVLRVAAFDPATNRRSDDAFGLYIQNAPLAPQAPSPYVRDYGAITNGFRFALWRTLEGMTMHYRYAKNAHPAGAYATTGGDWIAVAEGGGVFYFETYGSFPTYQNSLTTRFRFEVTIASRTIVRYYDGW